MKLEIAGTQPRISLSNSSHLFIYGRVSASLRLCALIVLFSIATLAQTATVEKVEPPNWWTGMTINPVRVLLRGSNLGKGTVWTNAPFFDSVEAAGNDKEITPNIGQPLPPEDEYARSANRPANGLPALNLDSHGFRIFRGR